MDRQCQLVHAALVCDSDVHVTTPVAPEEGVRQEGKSLRKL